jgi:hypothetical protein
MIEDQPSKIDLNVPQSRILAPDYTQDAEASSYVERRQPEVTKETAPYPPFYPIEKPSVEPTEQEEGPPIPTKVVVLKEGFVVERVDGEGSAIILHMPVVETTVEVEGEDEDEEPVFETIYVPLTDYPPITVLAGEAIFIRYQTDTFGNIKADEDSVMAVVDDPNTSSIHHVPDSVEGDYYIKVGEHKPPSEEELEEDSDLVPVYITFVQSDIEHYHEASMDAGRFYSLTNYDGETENAEDIGRVLYQETPNDPDDGGKSWVLRVIEGEERVSVESEDGAIRIESANFSLENYTGGYDGDGQILESEIPNDPDDGGKVWRLRTLVAGTGVTITNEDGLIEIATDGSGPSSVKTEQSETTVQANTDCINILGTGGTRADDVLEFTAGAGNQTDLGIKTDSVNTGKVITHNGTQWTRDYVRLVDI